MDFVVESDHLLTEILLRLPAKSLMRFKSVSKKWLSLISSDYFSHQHTLRRPKPQPSLILYMNNQLVYFNPTIKDQKKLLPFTLSVPNHQILQSCNGLMLLKSKHIRCSYYVYNPATRRSRKITLTRWGRFRYVAGLNLAFDPSKSPHYKIVCVKSTANFEDRLMEELPYQIEVYDSMSHSWELRLEPFPYTAGFFATDGVHWDGVHWNNNIYWFSHDSYHYFDISKNEMKTVSIPETPNLEAWASSDPHLEELSGHLYYVVTVEDRDGTEAVTMWELGGDDRSQWLLKHHHHAAGCDGAILKLVGGSYDEGACRLLIHGERKIRSYSFLDKTFEDLVDMPFYYINVFQFGEILALV